jgi:hypothetical protein
MSLAGRIGEGGRKLELFSCTVCRNFHRISLQNKIFFGRKLFLLGKNGDIGCEGSENKSAVKNIRFVIYAVS